MELTKNIIYKITILALLVHVLAKVHPNFLQIACTVFCVLFKLISHFARIIGKRLVGYLKQMTPVLKAIMVTFEKKKEAKNFHLILSTATFKLSLCVNSFYFKICHFRIFSTVYTQRIYRCYSHCWRPPLSLP